MEPVSYFYNCSQQYLSTLSSTLYPEVIEAISSLPKRSVQSEINRDLFWILNSKGWSYDTIPPGTSTSPSKELDLQNITLEQINKNNNRELCTTSSTIEARWHADFAKTYDGKLVQIEAQFGKVESMFKDFCGFRIGHYERRLALGIEVVMFNPGSYFSHRRNATSGMAYFEIAKNTLPAIGLDCPIWLVGIKE